MKHLVSITMILMGECVATFAQSAASINRLSTGDVKLINKFFDGTEIRKQPGFDSSPKQLDLPKNPEDITLFTSPSGPKCKCCGKPLWESKLGIRLFSAGNMTDTERLEPQENTNQQPLDKNWKPSCLVYGVKSKHAKSGEMPAGALVVFDETSTAAQTDLGLSVEQSISLSDFMKTSDFKGADAFASLLKADSQQVRVGYLGWTNQSSSSPHGLRLNQEDLVERKFEAAPLALVFEQKDADREVAGAKRAASFVLTEQQTVKGQVFLTSPAGPKCDCCDR